MPATTFAKAKLTKSHQWLIVRDPLNNKGIVRACNDCGVTHSLSRALESCRGDVDAQIVSTNITYAILAESDQQTLAA